MKKIKMRFCKLLGVVVPYSKCKECKLECKNPDGKMSEKKSKPFGIIIK